MNSYHKILPIVFYHEWRSALACSSVNQMVYHPIFNMIHISLPYFRVNVQLVSVFCSHIAWIPRHFKFAFLVVQVVTSYRQILFSHEWFGELNQSKIKGIDIWKVFVKFQFEFLDSLYVLIRNFEGMYLNLVGMFFINAQYSWYWWKKSNHLHWLIIFLVPKVVSSSKSKPLIDLKGSSNTSLVIIRNHVHKDDRLVGMLVHFVYYVQSMVFSLNDNTFLL